MTKVTTPPPPLVPEEGDKNDVQGHSSPISSLFQSGHHKWGFLIYRTTYEDDEKWNRFIDTLHRSTKRNLGGREIWPRDRWSRMGPYLHWTVMEDPAFDGASKDAIRDHFRNWISTRTVERDGPGADRPDLPDQSPRYRACLYVDKATVDGASMELIPNRFNMEFYDIKGDIVLIDAQFSDQPPEPFPLSEYELQEIADGEYTLEDIQEDEEEYEPVQGRTLHDVGWMYVGLLFVDTAYNDLAGIRGSWENMYTRPPSRYPKF